MSVEVQGPLISIVVPTYNAADTLPKALASVRAQTYPHWECIVVDDGSNPPTRALFERLSDDRVHYIRTEHNRGRGHARQLALECARGDYLCMVDADDWMSPVRIERQLQVMEQDTSLALVSAGMFIVDKAGRLSGVRRLPGRLTPGPKTWNASWDLSPPPIPYAPSMIRMDLAREVGFDKELVRSEDLDFLVRLLRGRRCVEMDEILYVYRVDGEDVSWEQGVLHSLESSARVWSRWRKTHVLESMRLEATAHLKRLVYRAVFAAGLRPWVFARWLRAATPLERAQFEEMEHTLQDAKEALYASPSRVL